MLMAIAATPCICQHQHSHTRHSLRDNAGSSMPGTQSRQARQPRGMIQV